jgi:outer membrane protease E
MRIQRRKQPAYIFTFLLLISLYPITVIAEQPRHHWSIENSLGFTYGHARELVYQYPGSPDLLSELVWPLEGLLYYGTSLTFSYGKSPMAGFYSTLGVRFGFFMQSGTITDKDWLNADTNGYFLTNFSAHDAISEHSQWVDATIGYGFIVSDRFIIRTGLTASFMNLHWTARDGYIQYGSNTGQNTSSYVPWSSSFPKVPVYGTGIAYWQNWVSIAPTLEVLWLVDNRLSLTAAASVYVLNSCNDQDDHYLRELPLQFTEHVSGGFGIEPKLTVSYRLVSNISVGIEGTWRYITGLRGNTSTMEIGSGMTGGPYADLAGTDYSVGSCAVFVRFTPQR